MIVALLGLGVVSLLELLLWLPWLKKVRRYGAIALVVPVAFFSGLVVSLNPSFWTILLLFFGLYRLVNLLRVIENRPHGDYLGAAGWHSSWLLISWQLLIVIAAGSQRHFHIGVGGWLTALLITQYACAAVLLASTLRHLRTTLPFGKSASYADRELPTMTVAIPARNETDDLEACLQTLIASDYPKLEILVLDDCSQLKRTPEIIRAFAHDGVRFIAGEAPPERWLAKNYAYKQLAEAANGEIVLFCGVDVRFQPYTVRNLVTSLLAKNKQLISVIPHNERPDRLSLERLLIQPGRYAWELALPRRFLNRPPVLSTCWLTYRKLLKQAGGFEAVSHSISPESYFARWAAQHDDGYSFLQSNDAIGLLCSKSVAEQRATAVRTRYPQLHRRPELAGLLTLLELSWLAAPFGLLVVAGWQHLWLLALLSALDCLVLLIFYGLTVNFTYRTRLAGGFLVVAVAALYDIWWLNNSMWQYEFREVMWKNRNVCVPVMRAISGLPKA